MDYALSCPLPGEYRRHDVTHMRLVRPETLDAIPSMPLRPDDILVASYPKSGTTWMCEMVSRMIGDSATLRLPINSRTPNVEFSRAGQPSGMQLLADRPSPRAFFSHLRFPYYEKEFYKHRPRVIFLLRNPKDILVSYYQFFRASGDLGQFTGTFHDFMEIYLKANRLPFGSFVDHARSWYDLKDEPNVLLMTFEDMKDDHQLAIEKIARHIGHQLDEKQLQEILKETSFDAMQTNQLTNREALPRELFNPDVSRFIRKGEVGDWQNYFSDEDNDYVERTLCEPLREMGLTLRYV